jgi:acylglycerol lipase
VYVVNIFATLFTNTRLYLTEKPEFKHLPCFLFGESMGGAVALMIHLKQPDAWNGAILVAPMCKVYT